MQICLNTPLPTLDSILASFKYSLTFPPPFPKLPSLNIFLPSFGFPLFPNLNIPNLETVMAAIEFQAHQLITTVLAMIKPVIAKLGIAIDKFLPKIPGLPGLNLLDLISGNWQKLIAAVRKALDFGFSLPMLPIPLYPTLKIPDLHVAFTLQAIIANYMFIVIDKVAGIVQRVTKLFKGMPFPTFPKFPSPEDILMSIISKIPGLPSFPSYAALLEFLKKKFQLPHIPSIADITAKLSNLVPNIDISALFAKISLPAMPKFPQLPNPLIPSFNMPDIELAMHMLAFNINLQLGLLKPIMDFILNVLGKKLSFTFPKLCITLPDLPTITIPTLKIP
jgi:hypothetical protein